MNEPKTLQEFLMLHRRQHRRQKLYTGLAVCWGLCALASLGVLAFGQAAGFDLRLGWPIIGTAGAVLAALVFLKVLLVDWLTLAEIVQRIERHHPDLNKLLETASEQIANNDPDKLDYLQQRVLTEALSAAHKQGWEFEANGRLAQAHLFHAVALVVFVLAAMQLPGSGGDPLARQDRVVVEPGNFEIERGLSRIISAKFTREQGSVTLVLMEPGQEPRRRRMVQSLDDPTYSYRLANVQAAAVYRVEYGGQRGEDYRMTVFDYPELKSSEAKLDYPEFTGRDDKVIPNTRRLTAVEGTGLTFDFQFNKPLQSAVLKARDGGADDIPLKPLADGSPEYQLLRDFDQPGEFRYELHLEDAEGRENQSPARYVFTVLENVAPALKFEAPTGDTEVSSIEEMRLHGEARDDFGLADAGIGYQLAGEEPQYISLGADGLATNRLDVAHVLRMEDLGVEVGQVVSYFLWADDRVRDGGLRRGFSDLYFATVRPFEEIFRQNRSATEGMRQQQQQGEGGEQGGEQQQSIANMLDTQKEIISATWNLKRRDANDEKLADDIGVVLDSQEELVGLLEQASALLQDAESGGQAYQANEAMQAAADRLAKARDASGDALGQALSGAIVEEQTALQHLQKLRENEFRVSRQQAEQQARQRGRGNSNRSQRQLDQLQMQDSRNNYELESKAERQQQQARQQGERAEQLQTLNRLKELARRQSDLNERVQELQIALLDAEDEAERERIERELKRLQEEQRELIDDLDEVQQRMESSQDDELAESRRQLEEAREQMEETARNLQREELSQAANTGSRASRNLDDVREDYREQTASEFADAMREMRQDARELDNNQRELNQAIDADREATFRPLSDEGELKEAIDMAESQKEQLEELLQQMEQVSREAEASEKLLSQELEDGVRRARQQSIRVNDDISNENLSLEAAFDELSNRMRNNLSDRTGDIQRELTENISELRGSVEDAAEKIIGSDEDAMRFAADQLDELREEVEREMELAQNEGRGQQPGRQREQQGNEPNPLGQGQRPQDSENQPQRGGGQGQPSEAREEDQQQQGNGQAREEQPDQPGQGQAQRPGNQARRPDANRDNAGGSGGSDLFRNLDNLDFDGPLTGLDYRDWEDRLREVEEVIEIPELRNQVSEVRQSARDIRRENRENGKPPKWDLVDMQILRPMTEINKRLEQELSLRQPKREMVPVDHEPVPAQYSELVRRYYERLGGRKEPKGNKN
ncbi:MAG: hypothetical protein QGG72_12690 [Verrucomicrobiota bacterium]|jgi:hypothetical protein|nr:hypothetical protein [Verrucomicrobiota bacterium]